MAIDRNFLEGVGMGAAVLHAGHIGKSQAEAAGSFLLGTLAIVVGDLPEHVGPLGIAGKEDHTGFSGRNGRGCQLGFDGLEIATALLLTLRHLINQSFLALAAVERYTKIAGDLTQLTQGQTCQ